MSGGDEKKVVKSKNSKKVSKHRKEKVKADVKVENNEESKKIASEPKPQKSRDFSTDLMEYLSLWRIREQNSGWKFNKVLQAWALDNCLDKDKIDSKLFKDLIPYIMTVKGGALERLSQKALDTINQKPVAEGNEEDAKSRPNLKRALKIHQCISEL